MTEKRNRGILITCVALLFTLSLGLIIALILQAKSKGSNVCMTKDCTVAAASLIRSMDEKQDPCKDFYSYVCSQYMHKTPELYDHFVERKKLLKLQVREFMEKPNLSNDSLSVKKARLAYKVCLNTTRIEELGIKPLKTYVEGLGGWPIAVGTDWLPPSDSFIEDLLARLEVIGYPGKVFKLSVSSDPVKPDVKLITLDQPSNGDDDFDVTRKKKEDKDKETEAKIEIIETTVRVFGNNNTVQIKLEIEEMIQLTDDLEELLKSSKERKDQHRLDNKMTIKHLHEITNNTFNWFSFLQNTFGKDIVTNENNLINVMEVEYMQKMPKILMKYGRRTVTNFAMWNAISDLFEYVTDKAFNQDSLKPTLRWQTCIQDISDSMVFAMWRMFAEEVMTNDAVEYARELIDNLNKTYRKTIEKSKWLDPKTKENALKKLATMVKLVGYPEWVMNNNELDKFYEDYQITNDHFTNMVTANGLSVQRVIRDIFKPVNREEWPEGIGVLTANAFYVASSNAIYLPGGILQPPFYSPNRPQAMNYGSIGAIIGHEIGHAFDDEGSQIDAQGALNEWWTKSSLELYTSHSQCFRNQYDTYCFDELKLNTTNNNNSCIDGSLTLGENVPDNTGVQCAFNAYKRWVKTHSEENILVGLTEFSPEQLFFLSYAYTWCENITPKQWFQYFGTDPHSPGRYRVIGPLSNFQDFSQTFQCNLGRMNRGNSSCTLW